MRNISARPRACAPAPLALGEVRADVERHAVRVGYFVPGAPASLGMGDVRPHSTPRVFQLARMISLCAVLISPLGCEQETPAKKTPKQSRRATESNKSTNSANQNNSAKNFVSETEAENRDDNDDAASKSRRTASPNVGMRDKTAMPVSEARKDNAGESNISSSGNAVAYKPGITLNYEALQVEVDAQVILRQGELELLLWAESPTPKGHETILATKAKPSDIYEALGLMGLTPGSPPWFDYEKGVAHAAKGDAVDVRVRYQLDNQHTEHNICEWVTNKARQAPMERRDWVFCGSRREENGRFAADFEGTVITVVDFPSSLLSLAESHSESNAKLWLVANAERIPEIDTSVTVILRAVKQRKSD